MAEPMVKIYSHSQFNQLLAMFQNAIDCGEYTEKIPYDTWRKLKKMSGDIKVEYYSPFVKISYLAYTSCGEEVEAIVFSDKTYNNGFGRFFYDYVVKERSKMQNTKTDCTAYDSKLDSTSVTALNEDISKLASKTTADVNYAYDNISITTPSSSNGYGGYVSDRTTNINIPNYSDRSWSNTGSAVTGSWLELAQKEDIEALKKRIDKMEADLQKKANKETKCLEKENETMMKGINFDFGPCGNTVRLSMYGMAIQNVAGEWVSYNPDSKEIINVDVFNIADGGKYMYKMPVAIADVKIGDIVIHNRVPMFVTAINENGTFEVTDVRAGETKSIIPTRNMFGFNFMTKVVSLFGAFTDAPTADQPFGNMLPFLMMDDNKDIDPMMMFMMMNQGGSNMFSNPMMMYFIMKDNKDIDPMVMFLMMSQNHTCNCGKTPAATVTQA